jgi:hypothetical protein
MVLDGLRSRVWRVRGAEKGVSNLGFRYFYADCVHWKWLVNHSIESHNKLLERT